MQEGKKYKKIINASLHKNALYFFLPTNYYGFIIKPYAPPPASVVHGKAVHTHAVPVAGADCAVHRGGCRFGRGAK